jgi:inward rectifier potassium channel
MQLAKYNDSSHFAFRIMNRPKLSKSKSSLIDQGFGTEAKQKPSRLVNADGQFNVQHRNRPFAFSRGFHYFVSISWPRFFMYILGIYVFVNLFFGFVYTFCGIEEITQSTNSFCGDVFNGFFFSAQTKTTVGYGGMTPSGPLASWISSFEALLGLLFFSFITGILYGRFSKPEASIKFSKCIIHRPFKEGSAIMFRLMNSMPTVMIRPSVTLTLALHVKQEKGTYALKYYPLKLQFDKVNFLPTTWTLVHEIEEDSPFLGLSKSEMQELEGEFLIMVQYFDETYDQEVYQVHSYLTSDLLFDVKFIKAYYNDSNGAVVLDHGLLSETEAI